MDESCMLIADSREVNVLRHEHELSLIPYEVKQITVGDYVVLSPVGNILAVIERKSLEDFSASIKDGRSNNKKKLIDLRTKTGCRIIYLIEGPAFPSPDMTFGRISYKNIESSIFHLMIRDNISMIYTKNTLHTAKTLVSFIASMNTLMKKITEPIPVEKIGKENKIDGAQDTATDDVVQNNVVQNDIFNDQITPISMIATPKIDTLSLLTQKHGKSTHEVTQSLWSCFSGITVESADDYMKKWSLSDIIRGKIPMTELSSMKLSNGRKPNKRVIGSLSKVEELTQIRLLSRIPNISMNMAKDLIKENSLSRLLSYPEEVIAMKNVGKRRLGVARAKNILLYFNYKYVAPQNIPEVKPLNFDITNVQITGNVIDVNVIDLNNIDISDIDQDILNLLNDL